MTALSETSNKVQAFELGAVDYITKPFQQEEVLARVNTHITISKLQKQLQAQNEQLIKLNQEKNEFLSIAAHDLKNPLSDIHMVIDFLKSYSDQVPEKVTKMLDLISISSKRMFDLIKDILDINAIEAGKMNLSIQIIDLHEIVQLLLIRYTYRTEKKNITLLLQSKLEQCLVFADYNSVCQVLDNLVSNAIKFSPNDKQVQIRLTQNDNYMCCEVQDEGPGLNAQDQQRLFGKFARAI
jgi:signal transduction histidine kinase